MRASIFRSLPHVFPSAPRRPAADADQHAAADRPSPDRRRSVAPAPGLLRPRLGRRRPPAARMGHLPRRPPLRQPLHRCIARGSSDARCALAQPARRSAQVSARQAVGHRACFARHVHRAARTRGRGAGLRGLPHDVAALALGRTERTGRSVPDAAGEQPRARRAAVRAADGVPATHGPGAGDPAARPGAGLDLVARRAAAGAAADRRPARHRGHRQEPLVRPVHAAAGQPARGRT